MESLTISDEVFDETHTYVGKDGEILSPPSPPISNKIVPKRIVKRKQRSSKMMVSSLTNSDDVFDEIHAHVSKDVEILPPPVPTISNQDINI